MDSVQMLDNLNVGAELEEWPLHRDLTLSPPLKSQPITLEQEGEHLTLKSNSVSRHRYFLSSGRPESRVKVKMCSDVTLVKVKVAHTDRSRVKVLKCLITNVLKYQKYM